jgi:hypothetical protein
MGNDSNEMTVEYSEYKARLLLDSCVNWYRIRLHTGAMRNHTDYGTVVAIFSSERPSGWEEIACELPPLGGSLLIKARCMSSTPPTAVVASAQKILKWLHSMEKDASIPKEAASVSAL